VEERKDKIMDILFTKNSKKNVTQLKKETVKDLALWEIVDGVTADESERLILKDIFGKIPTDLEDIRYRQEIMKDFLKNEMLADEIAEALSMIKTLKDYENMRPARVQQDHSLYILLEKLRELSVYVNVSEAIVKSLRNNQIESKGLCSVLESLEEIVKDEHFEKTKQDINQMLEEISSVKGAIVGVNFTPDLNVEQVSVVEFVPYKVKSKYTFAEIAASMSNIINAGMASNSVGGPPVDTKVLDPLLVTMTPQIEKHLKRHFSRIKHIMMQYVKFDGAFITEMYEGFTFYLAMAKFARRLQEEGYEICMPEVSGEKGTFQIKDLYNVRLFFAHETNVVKNDFSFTPKENMYILTGPNRGGKTIIEQALGIISVMTSIGSFVTASSCVGVPFCNVLTHFPIDENLTINYGRLGEEAIRIKEIVDEADDRTLILFNETYSTTSASDGLYLSMDLLHVLKELGSAVIFNTHIHELAKSIVEMNGWEGESDIVSIVMEIKNNVNTFRVKRSEPELKSYAKNIAEKYGITYEQMKETKESL